MYAPHFGLKQDPFSIAPDPHYLYMSELHREALAHLLYGVGGGGGFVLLTGEIGAGKTTVCRCFLEQVPANCNVAYIFNPKLTARELLASICDEFHIQLPTGTLSTNASSLKDLTDALNTFLLKSHTAGQNSLLIIDEAQNLSASVLEQLRLLTNLETNERKLLQIVLIGQPELRRMLAQPELEQLAQRVIARYHLEALTPTETAHYIAHRLGVAGLKGAMPFSKQALKRVQQLSRGVPRRINLLCGRAMLGAYATGQATVNLDILDKAANEVFGPAMPALTAALPLSARPAWPRMAWGGLAGVLASVLAGAAVVAGLWWAVDARRMADNTAARTVGAVPVADALPVAGAGAAPIATAAVTVATSVATQTRAATATLAAPMGSASQVSAATPGAPVALPAWVGDDAQAWRDLASLWKLDAGPAANVCELAAVHQLQCFRSNNSNLALIRQLNRPGLVTLVRDGQTQHALLTGLTLQTATLGQGTGQQTLPLAELARSWRGDFATLWRSPPGYTGPAQLGDNGPVTQWLAARLASWASQSPPSTAQTLGGPLRQQIQDFQRAQGLTADCQAGPMTLMQLSRATGTGTDRTEPRLRGEPP
jgi:general secretion pathway protein A